MDDLTTRSFDVQSTWVFDVLGIFVDMLSVVIRSTGAGVKCVYCTCIEGVVVVCLFAATLSYKMIHIHQIYRKLKLTDNNSRSKKNITCFVYYSSSFICHHYKMKFLWCNRHYHSISQDGTAMTVFNHMLLSNASGLTIHIGSNIYCEVYRHRREGKNVSQRDAILYFTALSQCPGISLRPLWTSLYHNTCMTHIWQKSPK